MKPWIALPREIPDELEKKAEEICREYELQRSNSDADLVKAFCVCVDISI